MIHKNILLAKDEVIEFCMTSTFKQTYQQDIKHGGKTSWLPELIETMHNALHHISELS